MTKRVRIENADTIPSKVLIEVWQKYDDRDDELVSIKTLENPTDLIDLYIHYDRYFLIKELVQC